MENWNLFFIIVIGTAGIAILILSANLAVKKLIGIAAYFNLSSTFMGMTVVSIATSIPEITAHYTASTKILLGTLDLQVGSAIVLGSNIGSDVVQQTFIMGLIVFITGALYFRRYFLWKSMIPMILSTIMCIGLGIDGTYSRIDGLILFGSFVAYSLFLYFDERKHYQKEDNIPEDEEVSNNIPKNKKELLKDVLVSVLMLTIAVAVSSVVLSVTEIVVVRTGVSGSMIGVITLGIASALPELTTALAGIKHKEHGISLGTLVGSNITNPLIGIGGGALISTYAVPRPLILWDLPWEAVTGAILWGILWFKKGKLSKVDAIYLMVMFFVFIILRAVFFHTDF